MRRRPWMSREPRGYCSYCGKPVGTYIPKGGDGSQRDARVHVDTRLGFGRMRCKGSKHAVYEWLDD
jgi:hypothetical protein